MVRPPALKGEPQNGIAMLPTKSILKSIHTIIIMKTFQRRKSHCIIDLVYLILCVVLTFGDVQLRLKCFNRGKKHPHTFAQINSSTLKDKLRIVLLICSKHVHECCYENCCYSANDNLGSYSILQ